MPISRRDVLHGLAVSPLLLTRAEAQVTPEIFKFRPELEPLVALIERTPREQCAEMAVMQLKRGVTYRQFLAALFLAGIRNINPRPPGFALHCVFIIHAAHLLGMEAPSDSRLLPLFYALDDFKASQDRDAKAPSGDYTMRQIQGSLPGPDQAPGELAAAMEGWETDRAERAVVTLARYRSPQEVFGLLWHYGARDYRNIGHKAIFVANAYRTLQAIGWQHSEPVLRSLVLALLDFGKEQQVNGYAFTDQCYSANNRRVKESYKRLNADWSTGPGDPVSTRSILSVIRDSTPEEACSDVALRLVKGSTNATSVWDAIHLSGAELKMRVRGGSVITGIHTVTSANGLHFAYQSVPDQQARFLLLLQAVGWMGQFRTYAAAKPENVRAFPITALEPAAESGSLEEMFAGIPSKVDESASRILRLAADLPSRPAYFAAALRLTLNKTNEVHYFKYLAALIEDIPLVSAEWQPHLLAATAYYMKGPADPDSVPIKRAREALKSLA